MISISHQIAIILAIGLVVLHDLLGLLWLVGLKKRLGKPYLQTSHRVILTALVFVIASGIAALAQRPNLLTTQGFWIKMGIVALIATNGYFAGKLIPKIANQRFWDTSRTLKLAVLGQASASLILWIIAVFCGWALG